MIINVELEKSHKTGCVNLYISHENSTGVKIFTLPEDKVGEMVQKYYEEELKE